MRPLQARLVTLCQQVLALGVVLVVLTPASGVVSLDIVGGHPGQQPPAPAQLMAATVPTGAVKPTVTEVPLTATDGGFAGLQGRTVAGGATDARVVSKPQTVTGFAAVGVTWAHGEELEEDQISLKVRTRDGDTWSDWEDLEYHDEHGPDAGSAEGRAARPGTEPMFVGDVDDVQVEASTDGAALPDDLSLALVDPGSARSSETEAPAEQPAQTGTSSRSCTTAAGRWRAPTASPCSPRRSARRPRPWPSRRSSPAPSGAPTRASATRAPCATAASPAASCTTR